MLIHDNIGYLSNIILTDLSMNPMDLSTNIIVQTQTLLRIIDNNLVRHYTTKSDILTFILYYRSKEDFDYIFNVCELWKPKYLRIQYIGNVSLQHDANIMASLTIKNAKFYDGTYNYKDVNFVV